MSVDVATLWLIVAAAAATYVTRIGGYVLITRLRTLPPRVEAALNAVPAAVLTTLFAPALATGGAEMVVAMLVALMVGLRFPGLLALAAGWSIVMLARQFFGL